MQIVPKLFFIISITFTCATFGMLKNKSKHNLLEKAFFENFYSTPIKKINPIDIFDQTLIRTNIFRNKNIHVISNFFPLANCTSDNCIQYGTKAKQALDKTRLYELYTQTERLDGTLDIRELEEVILEQHELSYELSSEKGMHKLPRNINETEIIIEDPQYIKDLKMNRYKKIYPRKNIQSIITRRMYNANNKKSLDRMFVYGENMSIQERMEFKDGLLALLSFNYDEIFFDDGSSKIAFITDLEENGPNIQIPWNSNQNKPLTLPQPAPKPSSNQNQPTITVQRPPIWKDARVHAGVAGFVFGIASTFGLLKYWYKPS